MSITPLDRAALVLAGLAYLLFKLGRRLWLAVDDNLFDFEDD